MTCPIAVVIRVTNGYVNTPIPPAPTIKIVGMTSTVYVLKRSPINKTIAVATAAVSPALMTSPVPTKTNVASARVATPEPTTVASPIDVVAIGVTLNCMATATPITIGKRRIASVVASKTCWAPDTYGNNALASSPSSAPGIRATRIPILSPFKT